MKSVGEHTKKICAPRSLGVFLIQYMSTAPLVTALIIIIVIVTSNASANSNDIPLILFAFILPLILVAFFMLYLPNRYITRFIYVGDKKLLSKINSF